MERPRLTERALPRLSFSEGRCRVVIHDIETGDGFAIDPRAWVLLSRADGSRDLEGILIAASRDGVVASRDELAALLERVRDAGMIANGPPMRSARGPERAPGAERDRDARPIEALPGYAFRCDGRGSCCRLYATVVFSPLEAARARVLLPRVLDGGERHEHVFTPERGAGPCAGSAVALVDGRCAYLDGHRCAIHGAGGAAAKPTGCNAFPLVLVDDGERVRASMLVECACVLASLEGGGGEPIVPGSARTRGELDASAIVDELPATVEISVGVAAPLADYRAWSDAADGAAAGAQDAARVAWSLAAALCARGPDPAFARAAVEDPAPADLALASSHLAALAQMAARRAEAQRVWLGARDLRRRALGALAAAAELLADPDVLAAVVAGAGAVPADEAFYLHASLFGHHLARSPLVPALRDRAVVIWIARVFPLAVEALYQGDDDPAFAHPIAIVEALLRGHGLRRYLDEVTAAAGSSPT